MLGRLEGTEEERGVQIIWGDLSERSHLEELGHRKDEIIETDFQEIELSG